MTVVLSDPTFADRDIVVYKTACPECGLELEWAIETPPIPLTLFSWFDPSGDGERITFCPRCDAELPEGDLTEDAA